MTTVNKQRRSLATTMEPKHSAPSRTCKEKVINYNELESPASTPLSSPSSSGGEKGGSRVNRQALSSGVSHMEVSVSKSFQDSVTSQLEQLNESMSTLKEDLKRDLNNEFKKMINDVEIKLNKRIDALEETLNKKICEQGDLIRNYEIKISSMETHFTQRLDGQENEIRELQDTTTRLNKELQLVKEEKLSLKKKEAEKLSENLLLSGPEVPVFTQDENLLQITTSLIKNHTKYDVKETEIASVVRYGKLPANGLPDKRGIRVKFVNRDTKFNVMKCKRPNMKSSGLFINEELTCEISELFYQIRTLKKKKKDSIAILYTYKGVIKARKVPTGTMYSVFTEEDLVKLKNDFGISDDSAGDE